MRETPAESSMDVVEVTPNARRALRRAVLMPCQLVSHYSDDAARRLVTDLSPFGMWIDTVMPLHRGAEVVVSFQPPGFGAEEVTVFAHVTRVNTGRRRRDRGPRGMGLEFHDLAGDVRDRMKDSLRGTPPRPPSRRKRATASAVHTA